jgi:hypothetical protein
VRDGDEDPVPDDDGAGLQEEHERNYRDGVVDIDAAEGLVGRGALLHRGDGGPGEGWVRAEEAVTFHVYFLWLRDS